MAKWSWSSAAACAREVEVLREEARGDERRADAASRTGDLGKATKLRRDAGWARELAEEIKADARGVIGGAR